MSEFIIQLSLNMSNVFSPESMVLLSIILIVISFFYLNIKDIKYKEIVSVNCPNGVKGVLILSISVFIATVLSQLIKFSFKIPRPAGMLIQEHGYAFPSGHSTLAFAVCSVCIFLMFKYFKNYKRYMNYLYTIIFILTAILIATSRVVLHVHRPIDIIVGAFLGIFSAFLSIKIYYNIIKYVDKKIYK
jgi:membrane-associated phospholipid phosphatase